MSVTIVGKKYAVSDCLACYDEPDYDIRYKTHPHMKVTYPNGESAPATYEVRPIMLNLVPFVLLAIDTTMVDSYKTWYKILQFSDKGMSVCWIYTYPDSLLSV